MKDYGDNYSSLSKHSYKEHLHDTSAIIITNNLKTYTLPSKNHALKVALVHMNKNLLLYTYNLTLRTSPLPHPLHMLPQSQN